MTPIIELDNVDFGYVPGELTLEQVTLAVKPGESGCIVGPNGGGKSTLLKLFLGLIQPTRGKVRLFGVSPEQGRRRVGYMPQYHLLDRVFPITVFEVVLTGRMNSWFPFWYTVADRTAARRALEEIGMVQLADRSFSSLSGGQRQRVLIARALACDPTIVILDEATSALDAKTEAHVMRSIRERGITCIVVAHRLSTIRDCDEIIVLDEGRVVQRGTHDQLMHEGGLYAELVRSN